MVLHVNFEPVCRNKKFATRQEFAYLLDTLMPECRPPVLGTTHSFCRKFQRHPHTHPLAVVETSKYKVFFTYIYFEKLKSQSYSLCLC